MKKITEYLISEVSAISYKEAIDIAAKMTFNSLMGGGTGQNAMLAYLPKIYSVSASKCDNDHDKRLAAVKKAYYDDYNKRHNNPKMQTRSEILKNKSK